MSLESTAGRRSSDVSPLRRPFRRAMSARWGRERRRLVAWRLAYLAVLGVLVVASVVDQPYRAAITAWVMAGSAAWVAAEGAERDRARQIRRHDASGLPAVHGWRLAAPPAALPPEDLLALDLLAWLYDHTALERRPIRGHPRRGARSTYAGGGLRALARRWAAQSGAPVRQGDRTLARLRTLGVVRGVRLSQVVAHRLVFATAEDAVRAIERTTGRALIDWQLGRDPRTERERPPLEP